MSALWRRVRDALIGVTADRCKPECRVFFREHLVRIDSTFARHDFAYRSMNGGATVIVCAPEESEYPAFADPKGASQDEDEVGSLVAPIAGAENAFASVDAAPALSTESRLEEQHRSRPGSVLNGMTTDRSRQRQAFRMPG